MSSPERSWGRRGLGSNGNSQRTKKTRDKKNSQHRGALRCQQERSLVKISTAVRKDQAQTLETKSNRMGKTLAFEQNGVLLSARKKKREENGALPPSTPRRCEKKDATSKTELTTRNSKREKNLSLGKKRATPFPRNRYRKYGPGRKPAEKKARRAEGKKSAKP